MAFCASGAHLGPAMEKRRVPRIGRALDLVGLGLFLVGGGVCLRAWIGFGNVHQYRPGPHDPLWAATHLANRYLRLQHIGVALMAAGIILTGPGDDTPNGRR